MFSHNGTTSSKACGTMRPYDATTQRSGPSAASSLANERNFSGVRTVRPSARAATFTGVGVS